MSRLRVSISLEWESFIGPLLCRVLARVAPQHNALRGRPPQRVLLRLLLHAVPAPSLLDVMLVDLPETGRVDWDAFGFGCREPFFTSELKARLLKTKASSKKQVARAA